jgi:hypothetical protein
MAFNDDGKRKMEEAESSMVRKRLRLSNDDGSEDDSSDSSDSPEEEVSSEETLMNQLNTSEEKLYARCAHDILFNDNCDTPSTSLEPCTLESHRRSDEESSDDDDDDDDFSM